MLARFSWEWLGLVLQTPRAGHWRGGQALVVLVSPKHSRLAELRKWCMTYSRVSNSGCASTA